MLGKEVKNIHIFVRNAWWFQNVNGKGYFEICDNLHCKVFLWIVENKTFKHKYNSYFFKPGSSPAKVNECLLYSGQKSKEKKICKEGSS